MKRVRVLIHGGLAVLFLASCSGESKPSPPTAKPAEVQFAWPDAAPLPEKPKPTEKVYDAGAAPTVGESKSTGSSG